MKMATSTRLKKNDKGHYNGRVLLQKAPTEEVINSLVILVN